MSQLLRKRVQLIATTLRTRSTPFKRALVQDFAARALPRLGGDLAIVIDREFDGLEQAQAAHEYMESNANLGKIVLHVLKTVELN
jgi:NADPH:quinone reductase-like Zn-dependent oxidoreductase